MTWRTGRLKQDAMLKSVVGPFSETCSPAGKTIGVETAFSSVVSTPRDCLRGPASWPQVTPLPGQPTVSAWPVRQDKILASWPETWDDFESFYLPVEVGQCCLRSVSSLSSLTYSFPHPLFHNFKSPGNSLIHILHSTQCFRIYFP